MWNDVDEQSVKLVGGIAAGAGSNIVGIPMDRFRIMVAQDSAFSRSLVGHWRETMHSLGAAYTGGMARVVMKSSASMLNLYIPQELRQQNPFTASLATGFLFSPLLNVPRMLQIAKINGERYGAAARRLFTTRGGVSTYLYNTALFAPGEALRTMLCFGSKDFLVPYLRPKGQAQSEAEVAGRAAMLAVTIGPIVAVVESSVSLATETASTLHAKLGALGALKSGPGHDPAAVAALRAEALSAVMNPRYILRCLVSLTTKNVAANTLTFFCMFVVDEYTSLVRAQASQERRLRRRSQSIEEVIRLPARGLGQNFQPEGNQAAH